MKLDDAQKFWKKYIKADLFERIKLLQPIIKNFKEVHEMLNLPDEKFSQEYKDMQIEHFLLSYFDDLIETMEILK